MCHVGGDALNDIASSTPKTDGLTKNRGGLVGSYKLSLERTKRGVTLALERQQSERSRFVASLRVEPPALDEIEGHAIASLDQSRVLCLRVVESHGCEELRKCQKAFAVEDREQESRPQPGSPG